jgi:hypothetical protein
MTQPPRDWDREMAEIDRAIAKQGAVPASGPAPVAPAGRPVPSTGAVPVRRRSVALTWFWVTLAVVLSAALVIWPYRRECGLQLFFFLGAAGLAVVVAGLAAIASWSHRRGVAHVLALLALIWGGVMVAREVLPRIGYAKVERTWTCVASPAGGVTGAQGSSAPAGPSPASGQSGSPSGSSGAGAAADPAAGGAPDLQSTTSPSPAPTGSGAPAAQP